MDELLKKVLLFSLIPAATMVLGALLTVLRPPGRLFRSAVLHFAAGVVFSVVAVELLPDIIRKHAPVQLAAGFITGVVLMLVLKNMTRKVEEVNTQASGRPGLPAGLLAAVGIDLIIDGIILGVGFAAGQKEGVLLSLALSAELLSLGLATAASITSNGPVARKKVLGIMLILAALFFISAVAGGSLLHQLPDKAMEFVLSFGLAALLYLVTEELLTEAHEEEENAWLTSAFFAWFLLFLLLGMME